MPADHAAEHDTRAAEHDADAGADTGPDSNTAQRRYWTDIAGPAWVRRQHVYDRMLAPHGAALLDALDAQPGERVLDVGCGFGTTTLAVAATVAAAAPGAAPGKAPGAVLGVDISPAMIERARARAAAAGVEHARFAVADAQVDPLGEPHDALVSRFGVMFFADPVAAFANLRGAIRPDGRLAFVCWQGPQVNPFFGIGPRIVRPVLPDPPPAPPAGAPGPLAFADPDRLHTLLTDAGWRDARIVPHTLPVRFGEDGEDGDGTDVLVDQVMESELGRLAAQQLDDRTLARVRDDVRAEAKRHDVDGIVTFDSAVWVVTARR